MLQSAHMELSLTFAEWLKRRRKALDLTQEELAQRVGCSVFALRKIESGERRPSKQLAALLCTSLNIPPEDQLVFIRVARGELRVDRLMPPSPAASLAPAKEVHPQVIYTSLPAQLTPLVGRENKLAALERLLRDPECRLLTVTGPGGIGKTRLTVELASTMSELFPGGVYYVALASISSPEFIPPAIADVLGLVFSGPSDPGEQLVKHLASRSRQPMLLVLDNLEHLLDPPDISIDRVGATSLITNLLHCAPQVKLLVTSRERLNLLGEWAFEL